MAAMTTIKSAMRTTTNTKPCDKCNVPHRGYGAPSSLILLAARLPQPQLSSAIGTTIMRKMARQPQADQA
eukprot:6210351-Pleurochrysis_carterae.AAC.1